MFREVRASLSLNFVDKNSNETVKKWRRYHSSEPGHNEISASTTTCSQREIWNHQDCSAAASSYWYSMNRAEKVKCQQKSLFSMLQLMANNRNKHLQHFNINQKTLSFSSTQSHFRSSDLETNDKNSFQWSESFPLHWPLIGGLQTPI